MSRSYRHTPIISMCSADSEKYDKRMNNRKLRKATRIAILHNKDVLPVMNDVSDVWTMQKDGKYYLHRTDPDSLKCLRK